MVGPLPRSYVPTLVYPPLCPPDPFIPTLSPTSQLSAGRDVSKEYNALHGKSALIAAKQVRTRSGPPPRVLSLRLLQARFAHSPPCHSRVSLARAVPHRRTAAVLQVIAVCSFGRPAPLQPSRARAPCHPPAPPALEDLAAAWSFVYYLIGPKPRGFGAATPYWAHCFASKPRELLIKCRVRGMILY